MNEYLEALGKLGFNDLVCVEGLEFQVQTEVMITGKLQIRTIVIEGGGVRWSDTQPCPVAPDELDKINSMVHAQHQRNMAKAQKDGGG